MTTTQRLANARCLRCSFCGKSSAEVSLVTGPLVNICAECVGIALHALSEEGVQFEVTHYESFSDGGGI